MPNKEEHSKSTYQKLRVWASDLHRWMDEPWKSYGRSHREIRHDPNEPPEWAIKKFGLAMTQKIMRDHVELDILDSEDKFGNPNDYNILEDNEKVNHVLKTGNTDFIVTDNQFIITQNNNVIGTYLARARRWMALNPKRALKIAMESVSKWDAELQIVSVIPPVSTLLYGECTVNLDEYVQWLEPVHIKVLVEAKEMVKQNHPELKVHVSLLKGHVPSARARVEVVTSEEFFEFMKSIEERLNAIEGKLEDLAKSKKRIVLRRKLI
jgi:hypothetical protein